MCIHQMLPNIHALCVSYMNTCAVDSISSEASNARAIEAPWEVAACCIHMAVVVCAIFTFINVYRREKTANKV